MSGTAGYVTYEAFRASYPWTSPGKFFERRLWQIWRISGWYGLAFGLRIRVPNREGWFNRGASGAGWCWPWRWHRRYYDARVPGGVP